MSEIKFSRKDLKLIKEKKIPLESIRAQINYFIKGFPYVSLAGAATPVNGITRLSEEEKNRYTKIFEQSAGNLKIIKFIPSSGAASRMFKHLFEFVNESGREPIDPVRHPDVSEFIAGLDKLALADDLETVLLSNGTNLEELISKGRYREIVEAVLLEGGLNYGQLPKGLIRFHRYGQEKRTPVEEHLVEGASYCIGVDGAAMLHFTVSAEHLDGFIDLLNRRQKEYEQRLGVRYEIDFSIQQTFTDTIAVDLDNQPFRDENGNLLFRPGGHGALLANLNELPADIIFIKNIDNIVPDRLKPITFLYKKILGGILIEIRDKAFSLLERSEREIDENLLSEAEDFLRCRLNVMPPGEHPAVSGTGSRISYARKMLNRPIRVCGMVMNEGEPGGGPFWTRKPDGSISLQIVEASQIDREDPGQQEIVRSSTHFNPVDLVCSIRDHKGKTFDLQEYTDPDTGFISIKSQDGRSLKAQELPGLWNGGMAGWNTVFVEVPSETFNPVKTINDLLRPQHIA